MDKICERESVMQFNTVSGQETLHPLISMPDQSKSNPMHPASYISNL